MYSLGTCNAYLAQRAYHISGNEAAIAHIPELRLDGRETVVRIEAAIHDDSRQLVHMAQYKACIQQRILAVNKLDVARLAAVLQQVVDGFHLPTQGR